MDIKKLESFIAVMECGNIADASDKLYISESAISKHLKCIEEELNTVLFIRKNRSLVPTRDATILYNYARKAVNEIQIMLQNYETMKVESDNTLTIAAVPCMSEYHETKLACDFMHTYPDLRCTCLETDAADMEETLLNYKAQIGFVNKNMIQSSSIEAFPLLNDKLSVILPKNHLLAQKDALSMHDIKNESLIIPGRKTAHYKLIIDLYNNHGYNPKILYMTSRLSALMDFVEGGFGIGLMMHGIATSFERKNVVILPLKENINNPLMAVRVKDAPYTNASQLLWNYLRKQTADRKAQTKILH